MSHQRRYNNPPIEEAVCEFRFRPNEEWDLTIPGRLQSKIVDDYTGRPEEQRVIGLAIPTASDQPAGLGIHEGLAKVHLVTEDGKRKIGVGRNVLSIHMLRPYQQHSGTSGSGGWEEFQPRIKTAFEAYWEVAQPNSVYRISMRYYNKISVPPSHSSVRIDDYLKCAPIDVQGMPDRMSNYLCRVEYRSDDNLILILHHGRTDAPSGQVELLLDIDVISEMPQRIEHDDALQMATHLRNRERDVFELLITDKARELFDAD